MKTRRGMEMMAAMVVAAVEAAAVEAAGARQEAARRRAGGSRAEAVAEAAEKRCCRPEHYSRGSSTCSRACSRAWERCSGGRCESPTHGHRMSMG